MVFLSLPKIAPIEAVSLCLSNVADVGEAESRQKRESCNVLQLTDFNAIRYSG